MFVVKPFYKITKYTANINRIFTVFILIIYLRISHFINQIINKDINVDKLEFRAVVELFLGIIGLQKDLIFLASFQMFVVLSESIHRFGG